MAMVLVTPEELAALVRKAVRDELAERGYEAAEEELDKVQAAKLFGVTPRTVTNWMAREGMPHRKGHGGRVVFRRPEVATWAKGRGYALRNKAA